MEIRYKDDGSFEYFFVLDEVNFCPTIDDYQYEHWRELASDIVIIKDEDIQMEIDSSRETFRGYFEIHNEGGFSPLDLWRCMYEESVRYLGPYGHHFRIIEHVKYDFKKKIVSVSTAT